MSTSISTPASLATFQQPHASSSKLPHVTLSPVGGGEGNQAVAAVQGDGVWTYDLRTMRPMTSFTVPPSTIFSTTPVSFYTKSQAKAKGKANGDGGMDVDEATESALGGSERITAIALEKGEGVTKENTRKVIWAWRGDEEARRTIVVKESITNLHHIANPTHPILAVHSATSFSLIPQIGTDALHLQSTTKSTTAEILASQITFTSDQHTQCLVVDISGQWTQVGIANGSLEVQKEGRLIVEGEKRKFVSASISKDGVITAIDTKDQLVSKTITDPVSASFPTLLHPDSTPLALSLPTFGKPLVVLPTLHPTPSILLSIASSAVPALLSSTSVSSSTTNTTISHLALLGQSSSHVLTVGVVLHHTSDDGGRSVVYTCDINIPERGIGLNALLGSQARTEEYIALSVSNGEANGTIDHDEETRDKCMFEIEKAFSKGDIKAANARLNDLLSYQYATLPGSFVKKLVKVIFETALPDLGKSTEVESKKRGPYASSMITTLLQRGLVNDEMIHGGVVAAALLPLSDWTNIFIALPALRTIPSSALVFILKTTLKTPVPADTPAFEQVLQAIVSLPPPSPTYRVELKRGLGVEDATSVLEVLTQWAEAWVLSNAKGLKWDIDQSQLHDDATSSIPSLEAVINHSSLLLDSHLPLFLSHSPSHPLLTRLQAALEPLLVMQAEYRALRAPLEAVLTLSKRSERDQAERQRKSELMHGAFGKKGAKKQETMGNGNGNGKAMGEAKIGKWKVEDFVF